jgi:2-dehydropantoate 2-reductase
VQVVVYGAGAIGSLVGARLHEAGANVRLVARPAQVAAIEAEGLRVESGREVRLVRLVARERLEGAADLVLLTVKSQDVLTACREIAGASLDSTVVTMQNGVRSDAEAASVLGRDRVVGCVLYLSASYLRPGVVQAAGWRGSLVVGAPFAESRDRAAAVQTLLARAFPTSLVQDIAPARWTKLIANLSNAIPAATGLPLSQAFRDARLNRLAIAAMREGAKVVLGSGHQLEAGGRGRPFRLLAALPRPLAFILFQRRLIAQFPPGNTFGGSTLQSIQRGSSSELDYLNGEIVRAGADAGRPTPINAALLDRGQDVFRTRRFLSAGELTAGLSL